MMTENTKIKEKEKRSEVILPFIMLLMICVLMSLHPVSYGTKYLDLNTYSHSTVNYKDGRETSTDGIRFSSVGKNDRVTVRVNIPSDFNSDQLTMVYGINHAVVDVYFEDDLLYSYGHEIYEKGDMICHRNHFIEIPSKAIGKDVTICMTATEDKAFSRIAKLYLYPTKDAYHYYFDIEFGRLFCSYFIFIISIIILFSALFFSKNERPERNRFLCLSFFGLCSSLWMILAEGLQQFLNIDSYFLTTLEYTTIVAQIIPMVLFAVSEEEISLRKRIMEGFVAASFVYLVVISLLNYLNIAHFSKFVTTSLVVIAVNGIAIIVNSIRKFDLSTRSRRVSLLGVAVIGMTGISDVLRSGLYRSTAKEALSNTHKLFPIGVLVFFILLIISEILKGRERQEEEELNRSKLLASQMQPHFLYNTLASIREVIYEDPQYAADMIVDFTTYFKTAVKALSDVRVISFENELENIKAYTNIEKMRMRDKLQVEFNIEASDFLVPPLSLQPLVENSIRHGIFMKGKEGGTVTIHSFKDKENYIVEIIDTGMGFDVKQLSNSSAESDKNGSTGEGLKNLQERLRNILHASVKIDSVIGKGTTVTVTIPEKYNKRLK